MNVPPRNSLAELPENPAMTPSNNERHSMNAPVPVDVGRPVALHLLERIEAFGLSAADDPLGFESRLADQHGWTLGYALAVVEEYRRFLVLTQVAGHAVSPSPDVDDAWHLHLTRTAHYDAFCNAVFGRFLHHEPARAGEGAKHRDLYLNTLAAYRQQFGFSAPAQVWPASGRPVDAPTTSATWTLPVGLRRGNRLAIALVLGAILAGVALRNLGLLDALQRIPPGAFLSVVLLVTIALGWIGLRGVVPPAQATARDVLEPYEAAWFSGGAERMAMTAIVALTDRGVLLPPGPPSARGLRPPIPVNTTVEARCVHPVEVACLSVVTDGGVRFTAACVAVRFVAERVERRLVAAGIASDPAALPLRRARALVVLAAGLAIEFERIFHAVGSSHRTGFLGVLALAGAGLVFVLARRRGRVGARAERVLRTLRLTAGAYKRTPPVGQALAFGVALAGGAVLAEDLRFDGLKQQVDASAMVPGRGNARKGSDDSGCSSCSSCSSADGGSGCSGGSSCSSGCGGGGD